MRSSWSKKWTCPPFKIERFAATLSPAKRKTTLILHYSGSSSIRSPGGAENEVPWSLYTVSKRSSTQPLMAMGPRQPLPLSSNPRVRSLLLSLSHAIPPILIALHSSSLVSVLNLIVHTHHALSHIAIQDTHYLWALTLGFHLGMY